jgi:hypothetical protein
MQRIHRFLSTKQIVKQHTDKTKNKQKQQYDKKIRGAKKKKKRKKEKLEIKFLLRYWLVVKKSTSCLTILRNLYIKSAKTGHTCFFSS